MNAATPTTSIAAIDSRIAGIGLRTQHYQALWDMQPALGFIEVHSENYFGAGGQPHAWLERFRGRYALSLHGVGLSLGSSDALSRTHLDKLKRLVDRYQPALVSDHVCWGAIGGAHLNDLLPLPYTEEALDLMVRHVDEAQTHLKRRILVENVSSYLQFSASSIPEWEFLSALSKRSGCGILLDVNNIYVNSVNHGFDALAYLDAIAANARDSVGEIHLAGFDRLQDAEPPCLVDTHGKPVCDAVWALYAEALKRLGPVLTLIEWDTDIPAPEVLLAEAGKASHILSSHETRRAAA
jgi:uncharacterized protein (UPF0276 family)